ncbi:MAG: Beta-lactamase domain protein [Herbinix sp.]|jgi:glyoxylase-like metal-dependent hydrolase (beta-lactamase superfamily II)|nr:Beta-lactamase domain protein [Herbinix sp.]
MCEHLKEKLLVPGVWQITQPSNGVYTDVDMYLIDGKDKALLVDGGNSVQDLCGFLGKLTDKPIELLITHGHGDHAACIQQFEKVYMSHTDIDIMNWMLGLTIEPTQISDLKGGEIIDLGDHQLEVITLPGHTLGSVALLDRERQLLFSGDSLGSGLIWMQLPNCTSIKDYLQELNKLENEIKDMTNLKLCVGHSQQSESELGLQYFKDLKTAAEGIVTGEMVGTPTMEYNEYYKGLITAYGQMKGFVYKPDRI